MDGPAPYRRRLAVNTAAHGASMVWLMGLTVVTLPILLRGLGAEVFGLWVLVQTFSATTGWLSLADLGIAGALTRSVAGHASTGHHREHLSALASGLTLLVAIGAAASVLLALVGPHVLPGLFSTPDGRRRAVQAAVVLFSGQVFLEFVVTGVLAGLEGAQRVDLSRLVTIVMRTGQLGATAVVATSGHGLVAVAGASLGATAAGTVLGVVLLARGLPGPMVRPEREVMGALFAYGVRIAGLKASGVLHRTMDRLVVGAVVGPSGVALVEIATQVQGGASAILSSTTYVTVSASPWVFARNEPSKLRELLLRGTKYSMLATLPFVIAAVLLARPIVDVWVGHSYAGAAGLIALAVVYIGLASSVTVGELMLEGTGHAGRVLLPSLLTTIVNFGLSVVLVREHGVAGAFVATIVGMALFIPPVLRRTLQTYEVGIGAFLRSAVVPALAPAVAQVVLTVAVVALPLPAWPTLISGGLLGVGASAVVAWKWSFAPGERRELRSLLRRGAPTQVEGLAVQDAVAQDVEGGGATG